MGSFFFDQQSSDTSRSIDAFRAILTQMFHHHCQDHTILDFALVLMTSTGCGQLSASGNEVLALLTTYFALFSVTLVFDGIDECSEPEIFLQTIARFSLSPDCQILLSTRPTIKLDSYQPFDVTQLPDHSNLKDIKAYLEPNIQILPGRGLIESTETVSSLVNRIGERSRSMFLWAALMVRFLQSEALTPDDRHEAIREINLFEGLVPMYTRIIQMIRKRYSSKVEWSRIERMFRWVRTACRPLHVQGLHHAFGITVYSETQARCKTIHKPRLIARFGQVLGIMSGALIEIDDSRTVRFIHASMMDFLDQNNHCPSRNAHDQIFNLHSAEGKLPVCSRLSDLYPEFCSA